MKKDKQISVRLEPDLADQLAKWAIKEELPVADLARKLLRISAGLYYTSGSLHRLRENQDVWQAAQEAVAIDREVQNNHAGTNQPKRKPQKAG